MSGTAAVVEEWALVRLGVVAVLGGLGFEIVREAAGWREAESELRSAPPDVVVLGTFADVALVTAAQGAAALPSRPTVAAVIGPMSGEEMTALLGAGVAVLLPRSAGGDDLADAIGRARQGEKVVSPALLPSLVGLVTSTEPGPADAELLTAKERAVLARLAEGRSNREIAEALFVSPATVKTHLAHIYAKLGVTDRNQALARALSLGLLG